MTGRKMPLRRRTIAVAMSVALLGLGVGAGPAFAGYDEYVNGWLDGTLAAPWHTLTQSSGRNVSGGGLMCVTAANRDGSRSGNDCTSAANGLALVNYPADRLRAGMVSTASPVFVRARVTF